MKKLFGIKKRLIPTLPILDILANCAFDLNFISRLFRVKVGQGRGGGWGGQGDSSQLSQGRHRLRCQHFNDANQNLIFLSLQFRGR
jgi:hypothetical protein